MGFHAHYHAGDTYKHTAARENDISDVLNTTASISLGKLSASSSGTVRCKCYNSTDKALKEGQCVVFSEKGSMCGYAVPVENPAKNKNSGKKTDDETKLWAVLEQTLEPGAIGSCIVAGCAVVKVSGKPKDFVVPDTETPGSFNFSESGTARVVFHDTKSGKTVILIGVGNKTTNEEEEAYTGAFAVSYDIKTKKASVKGGWANANGTWLTVPDKGELEIKNGDYICVQASLKNAAWGASIEVSNPSAYNYPVAYVTTKKVYLEKDEKVPEGYEEKKEGSGENEKRYYEVFRFIQYHVSVAMFMIAKFCPGVK